MKNVFALGTIILTLSACGGAGDGDDVTRAQASTGFATGPGDDPRDVTFNAVNTPVITLSGSEVSSALQTVAVRLSADGQTLFLEANGAQFELARQVDDEGDIVYGDVDADGAIASIVEQSAVLPVNIYTIGVNNGSGQAAVGIVPVGFDTDPATVAATGGSVEYTGGALMIAAQNQNGAIESTTLDGAFSLTADFDSARSVSGNIAFNATDPGDGIELPAFAVDLRPGAIDGNRFSGLVTLQPGEDLGGFRALELAEYNGRFYGVAADDVAGTLTGRIVEAGQAPIQLQGIFVSSDIP